jgi:hypothetical protein
VPHVPYGALLPERCVTMGLFIFSGGRELPFVPVDGRAAPELEPPKLCQPSLFGRAVSVEGRDALPELPFSVGRSAVLPAGRAVPFENPGDDGRVSVFVAPRDGELFVGRSFVAPRFPAALLLRSNVPEPSRALLAGLFTAPWFSAVTGEKCPSR